MKLVPCFLWALCKHEFFLHCIKDFLLLYTFNVVYHILIQIVYDSRNKTSEKHNEIITIWLLPYNSEKPKTGLVRRLFKIIR